MPPKNMEIDGDEFTAMPVVAQRGTTSTAANTTITATDTSANVTAAKVSPRFTPLQRRETLEVPRAQIGEEVTGTVTAETTTPGALLPYPERNAAFTLHQLPLKQLFNRIRREFLEVEKATLSPQQYNFTTSMRYQSWNRYVNILAIEETIFPPVEVMPPPDPAYPESRWTNGGAATTFTGAETEDTQTSVDRKPGLVSSIKRVCSGGSASKEKGTGAGGSAAEAAPQGAAPTFPYINGNLVKLPNMTPDFVACQAPLLNGLEDFLRTLWHYRISLILMVTQVIESEMLKADRYWPPDESDVTLEGPNWKSLLTRRLMFAREMNSTFPPHKLADGSDKTVSYGDHILENFSENVPKDALVFGDMVVMKDPDAPYHYDPQLKLWTRPLIVQPASYLRDPPEPVEESDAQTKERKSGDEERRTRRRPPPLRVQQVQYTGWPDHGVPANTDSFARLLAIVDTHTAKQAKQRDSLLEGMPPVLVHCSAGIGRTGSLIGAYAAMQLMERGALENRSLPYILAGMRRCRYGMVQRIEQYLYIYGLVLKWLGLEDVEGFVAGVPEQALRYQNEFMALRQT